MHNAFCPSCKTVQECHDFARLPSKYSQLKEDCNKGFTILVCTNCRCEFAVANKTGTERRHLNDIALDTAFTWRRIESFSLK